MTPGENIGATGIRRSHPFGSTRTSVQARHALLAPDGWVPSALPRWTGATCYVVISAALGARFCQYQIELGANGSGVGETRGCEWFVYVLDGTVGATVDGHDAELTSGGYVYVPSGTDYEFRGEAAGASLLVFEKTYEILPATDIAPVFGHEEDVAGVPFLGDPAAMLQVLLPDAPGFDLAVNIFKYAPGATLPFVETHVMEHGLLMLAGEGIYRLEDRWYPVKAGDAIWMAPYCPQWFVATGKTPASYIYYKDVNRWPE